MRLGHALQIGICINRDLMFWCNWSFSTLNWAYLQNLHQQICKNTFETFSYNWSFSDMELNFTSHDDTTDYWLYQYTKPSWCPCANYQSINLWSIILNIHMELGLSSIQLIYPDLYQYEEPSWRPCVIRTSFYYLFGASLVKYWNGIFRHWS